MESGYHVYKKKNGEWIVKQIGIYHKIISVRKTQNEAWKLARRLARAKGIIAFLKNKKGEIIAQNNYNNEIHNCF